MNLNKWNIIYEKIIIFVKNQFYLLLIFYNKIELNIH